MYRTSRYSTPRCSRKRRNCTNHRISCLRSMKSLDFSIDSSLKEDGISRHIEILSRRTVKKSLEKYFGFTLGHLTSLLVEFIHQQASIGVRSKELTPFKDLLCIANEGNVSRDVLFIIVKQIKRGPLSRKWNLVLSTDLINDAARYDAALKRGMNPHEIPTPYFDANLPIPSSTNEDTDYESLDLDEPSLVIDKGRSRIPALVVHDEYGAPIEDPYVSVSYRKTPRKLNNSYNPIIFENVVASTPEYDFTRKIDKNWRHKMGLSPKKPPMSFYNDNSSYLKTSRIPFLSRSERKDIRMGNMTPRTQHQERMKDLMKEIHKINLYRPQYRYKFL